MTPFRDFDPAAIRQPLLRDLYAYWRDRCRPDAAPARQALDPIDIPRLLPYLMLIDVQREPFDLRYRLVGTALVEHMGRDTTGLRVEDAYLGEDWHRVAADYEAAVVRHAPVFASNDIVGRDDRRYVYDRLLLPLSSDGESVDMLIAGAVFRALV